MDFIIYDLEFNQDFSPAKAHRERDKGCGSKSGSSSVSGSGNGRGNEIRPCFEIIQIGAVKLDERLNRTAELNRYVKPSIYPEVSPFITELTGITTEHLSTEAYFPDIYQEFIGFSSSETPVLCVWGMADLKEFYRNIEFHGLDKKQMPRNYMNLQLYVSQHFGLPKGRSLKLSTAAELLKIPLIHPFHNAFYDAYYTAEILRKIYDSSIQPAIYDPDDKPTHQRAPKKIIDFAKLIDQFEKMYDRSLTEQERQMILLAYKMGKTRQFMK
ncbi:exonuclease domain-containing protein [Anoxybacterium hadale]|uniref:Exonuclease domain-containing protein n=1 Tax=Anoxybacterium hadale TaxID=3408580 RepID=A0ACD1A6Q2_9FIRM|nr:exonuclease domain-containing protein [Clostridiales bacterium]